MHTIQILKHEAKDHFDWLRCVGWVYAPKTLKMWNFTNITAPKGRVPCTILTKFTGFMRVVSPHNSAKFGFFISINVKLIRQK